MKVITFSRTLPKGHPRQGQPAFFVEQILNCILPRKENGIISRDDIRPEMLPFINDFVLLGGQQVKHHTIRSGNRFKAGDRASLRVWSGAPYRSKQIEFAQVEVKKVWQIDICQSKEHWHFKINGLSAGWYKDDFNIDDFVDTLARNDGLTTPDFLSWFSIHPKKKEQVFTGQIISWSDKIEY